MAAPDTTQHDSQLLTILDGLPIAVMLRAEDGTLLHANPGAERFLARLGVGVEHVVPSPSSLMDHVEVIDEDGTRYRRADLPVVASLREAVAREATLGYALPDGGYVWYITRAVPVALDDGTTGAVVTCDDVTERRALEQELRAAALKDPLTGLANRRALAERLEDAQRRRDRHGGDIGLLYLDLDHFKAVNDSHGHDVGDRVLIETGRRLVAVTRQVDTVCRMGGDEFVVLCTPIDGQCGLDELVERIRSMPPLSVLVDDGPVSVVGSIGSILVAPDEDLDRALRRADAAMYRAKRGRRHQVQPAG
ncbi:MAG: diguanylate cyclase/phosphodiesterase & domain with sensor(s) [Actinomycetia bacterium]|nr:diguanylate cyclase/phosphodiesterase & domain with sensor(s) [Actinomycetes bacterium]